MPRAEPTVVEHDGGVQGRGGEGGERAGDLVDAGAAQVAQRDAHHLAGGEAAQEPVQAVHVLGVEPAGGAGQDRPHGGLGPLPPHPGRAGGAAQEAGVARQGLRGQAGGAGEEHQRLEQVAPARELGGVEEAFHPGERQVGVGCEAAEGDHLLRPATQAALQPGAPVRRVRRPERRRGHAQAGDEGFAGHVQGGGRRFTAKGEKACCSGMSSRTFTFTWGGRVTTQWMASATSAPESGVTPW